MFDFSFWLLQPVEMRVCVVSSREGGGGGGNGDQGDVGGGVV